MEKTIEELLQSREEAKMILQEFDHALWTVIENFDGTLLEALQLGLVRLNFAGRQDSDDT